jgi:xanthine dehydrogenase YagS FAD-binding subunit
MNLFSYVRVDEPDKAIQEVKHEAGTKFLAGGTNLIDLMKLYVESPTHLVDINHLPLPQIEVTA